MTESPHLSLLTHTQLLTVQNYRSKPQSRVKWTIKPHPIVIESDLPSFPRVRVAKEWCGY